MTARQLSYKLEACASKSYAYSPAVEALEKEVRAMKSKERRDGTAAVSRATGYVRVSEVQTVETVASLRVETNTAPAGERPF